jgi:GalNAc5-diNAcBac-PP-undecaprenol beta-1,3-glucosyltransferase
MLFFSVIIPLYNRAHLIAETIQSTLSQTYRHFEVIVVDDGSTDNPRDIIEKNFVNESNIYYFRIVNSERGAARNYGLKQAKGDFAVFFDSDDWMMPDYLETLNEEIANSDVPVNLISTKYIYRDSQGNERKATISDLSEGWYEKDFFLKGNFLACNYCIRIKQSTYVFFPQERELATMEDWLFLLLNLEGNKIFIKDKICVMIRMHDDRSMANNRQVIDTKIKAVKWIKKNIQLTTFQKRKLMAWSHYFCGVHEYLDYKRGAAMKEAIIAIKLDGLRKKFLLLLAKAIVGRKAIKEFR